MFSWLTVDQWLAIMSAIAIFTSPVFALEIQKRLDEKRSHRDRKMAIFRKLMTTRVNPMAPDHVEALNGIEVEFYTKGDGPDKKVLDAWRLYVAHVNTPSGEGPHAERWAETKYNRLVNLLLEMSKSLELEMDEAAIRTNVYHPLGFFQVETELHALRKALLATFSGERPLQTAVIGPVQVLAPLEPQPRQDKPVDAALARADRELNP
jgi:hypothetical protein